MELRSRNWMRKNMFVFEMLKSDYKLNYLVVGVSSTVAQIKEAAMIKALSKHDLTNKIVSEFP